MKCKTFKYKKFNDCYFEVGNYLYNKQAMYIQIKNKKYGNIAIATVNMPEYFYSPGTTTIKNYSENSGMTEFLQKLGVIEIVYTKSRVNSLAAESETIDFCKINMEKLKEYSNKFEYEFGY
ncbi:MAG: hypothetical protein J6M60_00315 [Clostridia bacterium]|nr:hypothetical protein [Clostridia bacterium]